MTDLNPFNKLVKFKEVDMLSIKLSIKRPEHLFIYTRFRITIHDLFTMENNNNEINSNEVRRPLTKDT